MKFWSQKSGSQRTPDFALTPFETQQERESPLLRFCLPLLILAMGIWGSVYSMLSAFEIRISYSALAAWLVIYLIAAAVVYSFPNWSLLVMAPGLPLVLWAFFSMDELADGCICLMNDLLTGMTQNSPWVFVQYAVKVSSPSEKMWLETRFLVMACCLVTLIAGYFVVRRPTLPVFMLLTAPALLLPLFFTMMPDLGAFFALVGSWLMLYTQNRLARQNWNGQAVRRFGFSKKPRHSRRLVAQKNVRRQSALLMLGCVLLAWLAAGSLLPQTGYERPESLSELLSGVQKSFSWMQPQGIMTSDLHNLPDLRFTGATALEVSCETEQPLYLRGYAAGVFTGSKWEVLPDEEYEEAAASFSEYEGNPINPINLSGYVNYNTRDRYDVTIRNRATNRNTLFIPPGLVTQVDQMNNIRYRQDLYVETGWLATPERYRLSAMPMPSLINSEMNVYLGSAPQDRVPDEFLPPAEEGFGYEKLLDEYEIFLYEPYTALPDEVAEYARQWWQSQGVTNVFDKETQTITEQVNLYSVCSTLQTIFNERFTYTYTPPAFPHGRNYLEWFLNDSQQGYCVHYATAGTLLLRAMGIPARYAEGYLVTKADYENAPRTSDGYVQISDDHAHAWTEVYDPVSRCWVPVEFTPGFDAGSGESIPNEGTTPNSTPTPTPEASVSPSPSPSASPSPTISPSSAPDASGATPSPQPNGGSGMHFPTEWLAAGLSALAVLGAILLTVVTQRKRRLAKWQKKWRSADVRRSVGEYWNWCFTLLACAKAPLPENDEPGRAYIGRLCEAYPALDRELGEKAYEIGELARFGKSPMDESHRRVLESWKAALEEQVFSGMKGWERFWCKWLRGLC